MKPKLWSNESDRQTEDEIKKTGSTIQATGKYWKSKMSSIGSR